MDKDKLLNAFSENPNLLVDFISNHVEESRLLRESTSDKARILAQREADINKMRKTWSTGLLMCIVLIVLFDLIFIAFLGRNWLHYSDQKLIMAFIVENLFKIAGLAYIVVNFLFDRKSNK
mgnify:CR=1 FL=1